jgi:hypothetical protein
LIFDCLIVIGFVVLAPLLTGLFSAALFFWGLWIGDFKALRDRVLILNF